MNDIKTMYVDFSYSVYFYAEIHIWFITLNLSMKYNELLSTNQASDAT